jgi:hypothetical protein
LKTFSSLVIWPYTEGARQNIPESLTLFGVVASRRRGKQRSNLRGGAGTETVTRLRD